MSIIESHWENLTDEQWDHLARNWLLWADEDEESEIGQKWGNIGARLGLLGPGESIWRFLNLTLSLATTNKQLGAIAAGPIEYLLGRFGPEYIDRVEREVEVNEKLAKSIKGCNQFQMTDEIWARVQKLQAR